MKLQNQPEYGNHELIAAVDGKVAYNVQHR